MIDWERLLDDFTQGYTCVKFPAGKYEEEFLRQCAKKNIKWNDGTTADKWSPPFENAFFLHEEGFLRFGVSGNFRDNPKVLDISDYD